MKIIRRFFVYLITIFIVLLMTYGYVYRDDLFGKDTPAGQLISWMMGQDKQVVIEPESVPLDHVVSAEEPVIEPVTEPVVDLQANINQEIVAAESLESAQPDADGQAATEVSQEETPVSVVLPAESALPAIDTDATDIAVADETAAVATDSVQMVAQELSLGDLWKRARHSFHYRDYQTSVDSYQQLIARTQDNFDAYKELGDVYAYYGKNEEAANAYYESASILVRLGKLESAASFMSSLSLMDANKARALLDQLEAAKAK